MRLVNYKCDKCGREQEYLYMSGEAILSHVRCDCEPRDVYAARWDVKNNRQRARVFDTASEQK
jgi:DNA-directed RNA polymerase subunit RPC12/RpoP